MFVSLFGSLRLIPIFNSTKTLKYNYEQNLL